MPRGSQHDLLSPFGRQWPSYLACVVSFSTIRALWLGHGLIADYLHRADSTLLRLNLLFLLIVSFLPFPTRLLAEYIDTNHAERVATTVYGLTLFVAAALLSVLWRYALREGLVRPDAEDEEIDTLTVRLTPTSPPSEVEGWARPARVSLLTLYSGQEGKFSPLPQTVDVFESDLTHPLQLGPDIQEPVGAVLILKGHVQRHKEVDVQALRR